MLYKLCHLSEFSCLYALIFHYHKMLLMLYLRFQFPILFLGYLNKAPPNIVFAMSVSGRSFCNECFGVSGPF